MAIDTRMSISPVVKLMSCTPGANRTTSPAWADLIVARNEPGPESLLFFTVRTLGTVRPSSVSRRGMNAGRGVILLRGLAFERRSFFRKVAMNGPPVNEVHGD